ncbi:MAG TPA: metallophosphoesterase [Ignavibacteria bacterium]|nr:metallophosphoesterase [Ignavibacteria bacterium]
MYKIAHISDTHIKDAKHIHFEFFNRLLKDIKRRKVNHILLTGDIVDYGTTQEFNLVKNTFDNYGYYDKDKLTVIPGNHDIYGGPSDKMPSYLFIQYCRKLNFQNAVKKFNEEFFNLDNVKEFPYLKVINNIALIGLNSLYEWDLHENPNGTNGFIKNSIIKKLVNVFDNKEVRDKIKIVLIHHHFSEPMFRKNHIEQRMWLETEENKMKLYNKKGLIKIFTKYKVDFVLHGHTHISESYKIDNVTYVNSSGCVNPFTKEKKREYHMITIDNNKTKLEKVAI